MGRAGVTACEGVGRRRGRARGAVRGARARPPSANNTTPACRAALYRLPPRRQHDCRPSAPTPRIHSALYYILHHALHCLRSIESQVDELTVPAHYAD